ncbi:hypothetical protein XYCOK13_24350 [Xylanibacillus composti]|uniref:BD-FAE-like domain-containing protein n=1 Tax=Xylanibacillus composti TaxID=1572762 RepID=A0A8J4H4S8_9BACL|nr:alpha/beta hydrolase [Xylanibacillus composti]GIQ69611.1 hypothetical protein XYCOK13_24350 [Xylanibacillus composti]
MFQVPVISRYYYSNPNLRLYQITGGRGSTERKSAILFFHGAGFSTNQVTPSQFQHHASVFASYGMLAFCVEYRPASVEGLYSPLTCLAHARAAIRWVRQHADTLGIDVHRIVAAGASAGGYLSLCCAMMEERGESVSSKPDACLLFNAGIPNRCSHCSRKKQTH